MTVSQLLDKLNITEPRKAMVRMGLRALAPGVLDAEIVLKIDADAGRVCLDMNGRPVLDASFEDCESYVSIPTS